MRQVTEPGGIGVCVTVPARTPVRLLLISTATSGFGAGGYEEEYAAVFRALVRERGVVLVDRVLEGVAGNPRLLLYDGLHPNSRGHQVMAARIWPSLYDLLELVRATPRAAAGS